MSVANVVNFGSRNIGESVRADQLTADNGLQLLAGASAGQVLTSDASGNATWQAVNAGNPPGYYSVWATAGNSTATYALNSGTTAIPVEIIRSSPSGVWSISGGNTQLQTTQAGTYMVQLTINVQCTAGATSYGVLQLMQGLTKIADQPFQSPASNGTIDTVVIQGIVNAGIGTTVISCNAVTAANYQIIGSALGGTTPHTGVNWMITRID